MDMPPKNLKTTATIAVNNAKIDFATRNVKWLILPIIQIEAMTSGYTVRHYVSFLEFDELVVSNFPYQNLVIICPWFGCVNKNDWNLNWAIGKWKIKKLKQ
jgi:hypothetical protein